MSINENWDRWIEASIFKFLTDRITAHDPTWHAFLEGQMERETQDHTAWLEVRVDGPLYRPQQGFTRVEVEVNVEISTHVGRKLYKKNQIAGAIAAMMDNYIPVYKFGNLAGDDGSVSIGCLRVDDRAGIDAHKYGQIATKTRLLQGTVEAKYWINL